jgi:hypothetical protein
MITRKVEILRLNSVVFHGIWYFKTSFSVLLRFWKLGNKAAAGNNNSRIGPDNIAIGYLNIKAVLKVSI